MEVGFYGGIYPCYEELCETEFLDADFMLNLLPKDMHEGYLYARGILETLHEEICWTKIIVYVTLIIQTKGCLYAG